MIVARLDDSRAQLIWTHHHLLMDGWSTGREIEEVFAHYLGEPTRPLTSRYRDYIAWLARQDDPAAERFWKEKLQVLDAPTYLPMPSAAGTDIASRTNRRWPAAEKRARG